MTLNVNGRRFYDFTLHRLSFSYKCGEKNTGVKVKMNSTTILVCESSSDTQHNAEGIRMILLYRLEEKYNQKFT